MEQCHAVAWQIKDLRSDKKYFAPRINREALVVFQGWLPAYILYMIGVLQYQT
jgi:hypothetical protein